MKGAMSLLLFPTREEKRWRRYINDSFLILSSIALLTGIIITLHISSHIPDILLLYLLLIVIFACNRGFYAALLASIVAFFTFDFLFVPPVYSFVASKFEDILGLAVFLITAVITAHLASALRIHAVHSNQREHETRMLYDVIRATNRENDMEHQLTTFVKALAHVFSTFGIRDCMLLLPQSDGTLKPLHSATHILDYIEILPDETNMAEWVMVHARTVDLYNRLPALNSTLTDTSSRWRLSSHTKMAPKYILRLIPLKTENKVFGVLRLLIEEKTKDGIVSNSIGIEQHPPSSQGLFFSTFLEQAVTVIEQERLREATVHLEVLQQTETLRSALFSSVSHGLRTPLATIKAAATSLQEEEIQWDQEAQRSFAQAIAREADRLDALVENLLDMSRIEAGSLRLEKVWYPLDELVHDVLSKMQPLLAERKIQVSCPDDLPPVEIDVVQVEQVITNLLENAARYTPDQSSIEVRIEPIEEYTFLDLEGHSPKLGPIYSKSISERPSAYLRVSIADQGPGLPVAERERIFDKFYRLSSNGDTLGHPRGLGLGLAICQGIIHAHAGKIWVQDNNDKGAVFCFTLPLRPVEEAYINE